MHDHAYKVHFLTNNYNRERIVDAYETIYQPVLIDIVLNAFDPTVKGAPGGTDSNFQFTSRAVSVTTWKE